MRFPIAKEGLAFILPSLFFVILCAYFGAYPFAVFFLVLTLFFVYFFRNPTRSSDSGEDELIAPADGHVMWVDDVDEKEFLQDKVRRIAVFMSVTDVHVNRAPCEGTIERVLHRAGKFKLAFKKGIGDENERNYIVVRKDSEKFLLVQIAGFLARRIICYVREQDRVGKGMPVGMIAFGSRVDIYMPTHYEVLVGPGQKVKSGLTVLARKREKSDEEKKA